MAYSDKFIWSKARFEWVNAFHYSREKRSGDGPGSTEAKDEESVKVFDHKYILCWEVKIFSKFDSPF